MFSVIKGSQLRDAFISGANSISNCRQQVDALNVFPVPDGDTGTNMSMTINAAKRELETLKDDQPLSRYPKRQLRLFCVVREETPVLSFLCYSVDSPKVWKAKKKQTQRILRMHCLWVFLLLIKQL